MLNEWLFIDMADLAGLDAPNIKGSRQKWKPEWHGNIKYLSVSNTSVGPTILERLPNLRAVLTRSHGSEHIDVGACRRRCIGVYEMAPTTKNCAEWIGRRITNFEDPILLIGAGRIARFVLKGITGHAHMVDSQATQGDINHLAQTAKTIIGTVPAPKIPGPHVYGPSLFANITKGTTFISISRAETLDNHAFLDALKRGVIEKAHIDTLGPICREEILNVQPGLVEWGMHTAWKTGFVQSEHIQNILSWVKKVEESCDV